MRGTVPSKYKDQSERAGPAVWEWKAGVSHAASAALPVTYRASYRASC